MLLQTTFTQAMAILHPIALAPMGGAAGGALAAAVSNGGGLGLIGGGRGDRSWLTRELGIVAAQTAQPWGVGFLAWAVDIPTLDWTLDQGPRAVMLSFGDPTPFAPRVRAAGVPLLVQVTDMREAQRAADLGADVIIAQGSEAGGHGGRRSTLRPRRGRPGGPHPRACRRRNRRRARGCRGARVGSGRCPRRYSIPSRS